MATALLDNSVKVSDNSSNFVQKGSLAPCLKWAGGKYSSGVCDYLAPIYHQLKKHYPLYVAGFGGALGDVFYLAPEKFLALDVVPEVVNFHNWLKAGGKAYSPSEGKQKYYEIRDRFNRLNAAYAAMDSEDIGKSYEGFQAVIENLDLADAQNEHQLESFSEVYDDEYFELLKSENLLQTNPEEFDLDNLGDELEALLALRVEAERELNSLFYWFNKNAYNGMWRINADGGLNVPVNDKAEEKTLTQEVVASYQPFLQRGDYYCDDFRLLPSYLPSGKHFIYLDPPYYKTFGGYSKNGFGIEDQIALAELATSLVEDGHFVVASNSDTTDMCDLYSDNDFRIEKVSAKRRLSCKGSKRNNVLEMFAIGCKNPGHVAIADSLNWII